MWFIGVEVEQETSAPPPKKNPGSAPGLTLYFILLTDNALLLFRPQRPQTENFYFPKRLEII